MIEGLGTRLTNAQGLGMRLYGGVMIAESSYIVDLGHKLTEYQSFFLHMYFSTYEVNNSMEKVLFPCRPVVHVSGLGTRLYIVFLYY